MRDLLFRSRIFTYLAAATPGLKELVTIGKIWELAQDDRKAPRRAPLRPGDRRRAGDRARGRLPADAADLRRTSPGSGRSASRRRRSTAFIRDRERTGVAIVALPEEMPVNETATLERELASEVGVAVDRIFCNGLYPERFAPAEAKRIAAAGAGRRRRPRAPRLRAALTEEPPRRRPAPSSSRGSSASRKAPVSTLPFLFEPELGAGADRRAGGAW